MDTVQENTIIAVFENSLHASRLKTFQALANRFGLRAHGKKNPFSFTDNQVVALWKAMAGWESIGGSEECGYVEHDYSPAVRLLLESMFKPPAFIRRIDNSAHILENRWRVAMFFRACADAIEDHDALTASKERSS